MFTDTGVSIRQDAAPVESRSEDVIIIITWVQRVGLGADDWMIIVAWLLNVGYGVEVCMHSTETKYGLGKHRKDLPPGTDFITSDILFYAKQPLYYVCVSLTKVSILLFYFRLFPQQGYRIFLWFMLGFVVLTGITSSVAGIFQCNPIPKAWDFDIPGTCFNRPALFFANAGLNIFQDFVIYILPSPMLWNVQLPLKQRIALIGVFVVGAFVCITGIIRVPTLWDAVSSDDPTWDHFGAAVWSAVETNTGIVCACLVHFKPLIIKFAPWAIGMSRGSKGGKMIRLGDDQSDQPASSNLQTFGQRQNSKPVGILTEMELEDDLDASRSRTVLVPATHTGVATATARAGGSPFRRDPNQPNAIHTTTQLTISYDEDSESGHRQENHVRR
ncbi:hypothetical protein DL770_007247 [Monosporascus sp. CRB-9-2]|nr:hypothetical protein DL770_007247 [Monosporascus sp. CRB-9-2]